MTKDCCRVSRIFKGRYYARRLRLGRVESGKEQYQALACAIYSPHACMFLAGIQYISRHLSLFPRPSRSKLLRPDSLHSVEFSGELIEPVHLDGFANVPHQVLIVVQIMNRIQPRAQNLAAFVQVA